MGPSGFFLTNSGFEADSRFFLLSSSYARNMEMTPKPGEPGVETVTLRGGVTVPVAALELVVDLERRGFRLESDHGDVVVHPFSKLLDDDKRRLKGWTSDVLALLAYEPPEAS